MAVHMTLQVKSSQVMQAEPCRELRWKEEAAKKTLAFVSNRLLGAAMSDWVEGTAWSKHVKSVLNTAIVRLRYRCLISACSNLCNTLRRMSSIRETSPSCNIPKQSRDSPAEACQVTDYEVCFTLCRSLAVAWQAWREEAAYARAKRHSMLGAIQVMRNGILSRGWEAWLARCAALASARAQAEDISRVLEHRSALLAESHSVQGPICGVTSSAL